MTQQAPSPADVYEHYLGPAIAHPWTGVLLEYAVPRPGEFMGSFLSGSGVAGGMARQRPETRVEVPLAPPAGGPVSLKP